MPTAIISVGVPGSGKTTVLKSEAERRNAVYICADDIRLEMTGDAQNQTQNFEVWNRVFRAIEQSLKAGRDVVVDATNTHGENRRFLTRFCCIYGGEQLRLELWWFSTPFEECLRRNSLRDRDVPMHAMERKRQQLHDDPVDMYVEGYDVLVFV